MTDIKTHTRKSKSGKLIQISSHSRAGEAKKKSPTMRASTRAVVDKPKTPTKPPESPKGTRRAVRNNGGGDISVSDIKQKYDLGLKILAQLVINMGGIEKARENEEYQNMIKIMAKRLKELKKAVKDGETKEGNKKVQ